MSKGKGLNNQSALAWNPSRVKPLLADTVILSEPEFALFRDLLYKLVGIDLGASKKMMVTSRLRSRIAHCGFSSYGDYYRFVTSSQGRDELQLMINALTTNETFFFRESIHFDYLHQVVLSDLPVRPLRCWSAACSTGEETYSIAMTLADAFGENYWELIGSDVNSQVLAKARTGHYLMQRHEGIPYEYLKQFCLRGTGNQEGSFLINGALRQRVQFRKINLMESLPDIGLFDVIFLRNILIYFDNQTKLAIVRRVTQALRPGGYLFISHTENLHGIEIGLELVRPSIFRKRRLSES